MMKQPESKPTWWAYASNFPKPAILLLALLTDLVIPGTWLHNYCCDPLSSNIKNHDMLWTNIFINPMASLTAILALFQLNFEVVYMFLTKRRNLYEKHEAVAAAIKQAKADTKAAADAEAKAWFEQYQPDQDNAPPPWSGNGPNHNNDSR